MGSRSARAAAFTIGCRELEGGEPTVESIGFKAYNLWRMARLGLAVPPAFVLGTEICQRRTRNEPAGDAALGHALDAGLGRLESATGLQFGNPRRPLVVSVRSGAPVSMPGMLETVLDVGLNDATLRGLVRLTGNPRTAWDSYRRLVQSFATVVEGKTARAFDAEAGAALRAAGVDDVRALDFREMRSLTERYLDAYEGLVGKPFPQDPRRQLIAATAAVFDSWRAPKAAAYRALNGIDDAMGTAATVQQMVYGNAGAHSGSGVGFTRDPATGERVRYVDFLFNAQGEDVVSGRRAGDGALALGDVLPAVQREIDAASDLLEREFGDMQEFEFTVQEGRLFMLQTRNGKRTPLAAARIGVDMVAEGILTPAAALERVKSLDLARVSRMRRISDGGGVIARGLPAGTGIASGPIALDPSTALELARRGTPPILVRETPATEDIEGLTSSAGLLTVSGARTAHAVVVARQLGKVCVLSCRELAIDAPGARCTIGAEILGAGDVITLDGDRGEVLRGTAKVVVEPAVDLLEAIEGWKRAAA